MNDFEKKITKYWTNELPETWSFLGSKAEPQKISQEHKDQIHFLNNEGTIFLRGLLYSTNMSGNLPFNYPFKDYFKTVEEFQLTIDCEKTIKK